jgi:hypothetical protein
MAALYRRVAPDRIQIREGGGCLGVFGLPFFAAGVFLLLSSMGLVPMEKGDDLLTRLMLPFMGIVFTAVGGTLSFGRAWTTVDGTRREIVKQLGLMVPMHSTTRLIDDFTALALEFERGDSDSADTYPVVLKARSGRNHRLCSSTEYADARGCATSVAELLRLDFEDATTDHPVRLTVGQTEMPLQQRLQMEGRESGSAERPANTRCKVLREPNALLITIPTRRTHPVAFALTLIPVAISAVFVGPLSQFFRQTRTPDPMAWAFLGFIILFFGVLPAMTAINGYLSERRGGTIVTVSPSGIGIQERGAWKAGRVNSLAAADILDIDFSTSESATSSARLAAEQRVRDAYAKPGESAPTIGPRTERLLKAVTRIAQHRHGHGITIKSRQGLTTIGQGLDDDEVRYLHAIIRRALVSLS